MCRSPTCLILLRNKIPVFVSTSRSLKREINLPTWECYLISTWTYTMLRPMLWGLLMQLYAEWKSLVLRKGFLTGLMRCCDFSRHSMRCQLACASQTWFTQFLKHDNIFSNPLQVAHLAFLKRILGIKSTPTANWCVLRECAQEPLQYYWFRSAVKFWNRMVDSNSKYFTRCYESRYFPWEFWCF